ncbi:hypothetical protein D3C84_1010300 [compost metagenome]
MRLQLKEFENALGLLAENFRLAACSRQVECLFDEAAAQVPRQAGEDVVDHAHFLEQRVVLERAANASARSGQRVDAFERLLLEDN